MRKNRHREPKSRSSLRERNQNRDHERAANGITQ
jgi:hypothetical protein